MNRWVFRIHLWAGLVSGVLLLGVSLTGVALLFAPAVDHVLNPELFRVEPGPQRVSLDAMLAAAREARPDVRVQGFHKLPLAADEAFAVSGEREGRYTLVHVDPYRASVLGARAWEEGLEGTLLRLHYSLLSGRPGEVVVFLLGLSLLVSVLTGAWVYRRSLLRVFTLPVRWRHGMRAWSADVHRLVGVSSLLFNLVIAVTGSVMLWQHTMVRLFEDAPPPPKRAAVPEQVFTGSVDEAVARAREALPALVVQGVVLPENADESLLVYGGLQGHALLGRTSSSVRLAPRTLAVSEVRDMSREGLSSQVLAVMLPLHFGDWGGWAVKLLYAMLGLSPGLLSVTGTVLWWRKRRVRAPVPQSEASGVPGFTRTA